MQRVFVLRSSHTPLVFDYLQVFPAEYLHRRVWQAASPSGLKSSHIKQKDGTDRGWEGNYNFFFWTCAAACQVLYACVFFSLCCFELSASWGTRLLHCLVQCLSYLWSRLCGIYEPQVGNSVIFLSGRRFVLFMTWLRGSLRRGWHVTSQNLSFLVSCLKLCCVYKSGIRT